MLLGLRPDQCYKIAYVLQLANLRGRKLNFECLFDRKYQADMGEAIPAVYVLSRQLRSYFNGVITKDIVENLRKPSIDLRFVHPKQPQLAGNSPFQFAFDTAQGGAGGFLSVVDPLAILDSNRDLCED
jgi:hypothetical protein